MDKKLLNQTQVAAYLGVNRVTILKWRKVGFGPKFKKMPGGRLYATKAACDEFLDSLS